MHFVASGGHININTGGIPEEFRRTTLEVHGPAGAAWLETLPALLLEYGHRWSLTVLPPFAPLTYNYVAPAVRSDGGAAVIKVGVPGAGLLLESLALEVFAGRGAARLLESDAARGVLLLERLLPGKTLASVWNEEQATDIAVSVMRQLWRTVPSLHTFPLVSDWTADLSEMRSRFGGSTGPFPRGIVAEAETLISGLLGSMSEWVLLHGDLHHGNILSAEREPWLAIDPKGVVGEPAYEVGAFLRNGLPDPVNGTEARRITQHRLDQFSSELELDRERLLAWTLAQAVLSAWWSFEDHGHGWEPMIAFAELLSDMRQGR